MGRDKVPADSGSPEDWKVHILLKERLMYVQLKFPKPAMEACGDLSAEVVCAATGSLCFLSYTESGIIIFYSVLPQ